MELSKRISSNSLPKHLILFLYHFLDIHVKMQLMMKSGKLPNKLMLSDLSKIMNSMTLYQVVKIKILVAVSKERLDLKEVNCPEDKNNELLSQEQSSRTLRFYF